MLPVQPYHEGSYPPGAKFPQFGDDVIGGYLNAHAALAEKRRNMMPFHIGRLAEDGFLPMHLRSQVPASHRDPEQDAVDDFDRPSPPDPPQGRRMQTRTPAQQEQSFEDAESGGELALPQTTYPVASGFMNAMRSGANSTLADMTSAVAQGLTYGTTAVAVGTAKGIARGLSHYATGQNPASFPSDDEEELVPDKPSRPYPKAKAQSRSSGSHESPYPYPFTTRAAPFDVAPYNGTGAHAITISDEEEEVPGPAAAARRPRNSVRQSDQQLARDTLAGLGPNVGRGQRRR